MRSVFKDLQSRLAEIDSLFAFAMALGSVVYGNSARIPAGELHLFLQMRITLINAIFAGLFMVMWKSCFAALDLYRSRPQGIFYKLFRIVVGCGFMSAVLVFYLEAAHTLGQTSRIGITFFLGVTCYETCRILGGYAIAVRDPQLVVILGSGPTAMRAWRQIRTQYYPTVKLVGFVDNRPVDAMAPDVADRYLGTTDDLSELLLRNVVDELLVAVPMKSCYDMATRAIEIAEQIGVRTVLMQDIYVNSLKQNSFRTPELFNELVPFHEDYVNRQAVKRSVDIIGSLIGLCLLSPLFLLVAIAVKLSSKGPVFFAQPRYGFRRRIFKMYKFRSMVSNAPELMAQLETQNEASGPIFKIRHDPRITPLGRFLRASSLDELPQLWNVLLGNMSLVGPRPMSVRDVLLFSEATLMRRFTVKPGITGLWQVSGRNSLSFDKWIELDFSYIDRWSLALDFLILAKTVFVVWKRTGAV